MECQRIEDASEKAIVLMPSALPSAGSLLKFACFVSRNGVYYIHKKGITIGGNTMSNIEKETLKNGFQPLENEQLKDVAGGTGAAVMNPLLVMLEMYYHIAQEESNPAAKAEAVNVYNQTLDELTRQGIDCREYKALQLP